jgi:hypothetical protein
MRKMKTHITKVIPSGIKYIKYLDLRPINLKLTHTDKFAINKTLAFIIKYRRDFSNSYS